MSWDDVHDARLAFRTCLEAMSFPGRPASGLPPAGTAAEPSRDGATAVLLGLLDPGLGLACASGSEMPDLAAEICARTGAHPAPVEEADFILAGADRDPTLPERARRGTALAPERGATLVYANAGREHSTLGLEGPGVAGVETARLGLSAEELASLRRANANPPAGIDLFAVEADGSLVGLPRTVLGG